MTPAFDSETPMTNRADILAGQQDTLDSLTATVTRLADRVGEQDATIRRLERRVDDLEAMQG